MIAGLGTLIDTVQRNCDIADARHGLRTGDRLALADLVPHGAFADTVAGEQRAFEDAGQAVDFAFGVPERGLVHAVATNRLPSAVRLRAPG